MNEQNGERSPRNSTRVHIELAWGVLGGGSKVLEIVVEAARAPESIRAIRNLLILAKILGSIQPDLLEKFARGIPDALEGVAKGEQADPPGVWGILKNLQKRKSAPRSRGGEQPS